jgi:hypothetical protein
MERCCNTVQGVAPIHHLKGPAHTILYRINAINSAYIIMHPIQHQITLGAQFNSKLSSFLFANQSQQSWLIDAS